MKAEHRKELMTNSLAHRLGDAVQSMKEGPSRGTLFVLVAAGLIVILVFVWRYLASSAEESDSARWLKWDNLASPGQLKEFVEDKDVQGHVQGRLARVEEARRALHDGLRQLGGSGDARKEGARRDSEAPPSCTASSPTSAPISRLLHQQVLMGAAKAHESLGEVEQARKYYQQLKDKHGETVLGRDAAEQLQRLDEAEQNGDLKALREEYTKPVTP